MELVWKQLLRVMTDMTGRCGRLADLARRQREALVAEQVREVGETVIQQEQELAAFQGLEQERAALVQALGDQLHVPAESLTSNQLLALVPPAWSAAYREQVATLRARVDEVKQEHAVNRKLLQRSQEFVRWLLNYLVTPDGAAPVYDEVGSQVQRSYYHFVNQML